MTQPFPESTHPPPQPDFGEGTWMCVKWAITHLMLRGEGEGTNLSRDFEQGTAFTKQIQPALGKGRGLNVDWPMKDSDVYKTEGLIYQVDVNELRDGVA